MSSHRHSNGCGCSEDAKVADAVTTSLYASIDRDRARCFNEAEHDMASACLKPWHQRHDSRRLLSDPDDGEMMLVIPFTHAVHIKTIAVMAWGDWQPKKIKL